MNHTEADLKLAIATIQSVEQHLELMKKAIAHDAVHQDDNYHYVFQGMIEELFNTRERLEGIIARSRSLSSM